MRTIPGLLALLAAVAAGPVTAQTSFYDVEVIVFEHLDTDAGETERWRPQVIVPPIAEATAFETDGPRGDHLRELPEGFERLASDEAELGGAVERLNDSRRYRVLRHSIWRQPAFGRDEAIALRFSAGEPTMVRIPASAYPAGPIEADTSQADEMAAADVASERATGARDQAGGTSLAQPAAQETAGDPTYLLESPFGLGMLAPPLRDAEVLPLDGTVRLIVSRYLHLRADLYYTAPVEWTDGEDAAGQAAAAGTAASPRITRGPDGQAMLSYGMNQGRRMRSGELHYLDHPVIGLLVKVTPYEDDAAGG